jgi:hypothetical protein
LLFGSLCAGLRARTWPSLPHAAPVEHARQKVNQRSHDKPLPVKCRRQSDRAMQRLVAPCRVCRPGQLLEVRLDPIFICGASPALIGAALSASQQDPMNTR